MIKLKVKKLEDNAIVPKFHSSGAAGFDFHSLDSVNIPSGQTVVLRTGIALDIPEGYEIQIRPRSGLSAKTKIRVANAPGTIDSDYKKEIMIILDNVSNNQAENYKINSGERIAQGVLKKCEEFEIVETPVISVTNRGGLGSTGI